MGVETGTTRTIVEVHTDEGVAGIGETYGGDATVRSLDFMKPLVMGSDPFEIPKILGLLQSFRISYETYLSPHVIAGFEMACWDLVGKALNRPVASLLGGAHRDEIPVAAYPFFTYGDERGKGEVSTPEAMTEQCEQLISEHGFTVLKLKGGVLQPAQELRTMQLLRERFPHVRLRFDPNAAWSVETAITYLRQMEPLHLEYAEDPTWNLEGMSIVRQNVVIPFATNMCVIAFEHIPAAWRMHAIDIILSDVHYWGGLHQNQRLAAVAETFQIGLGMHSDRELGVSTAAMVHFAAATPYLSHAIDSHYHYQADDIITRPWVYHGGKFRVPDAPGLSVTLDLDKLAFYHRRYQSEGSIVEFLDPRRPGWVPKLPIF
jgi:glucarate dehydratase